MSTASARRPFGFLLAALAGLPLVTAGVPARASVPEPALAASLYMSESHLLHRRVSLGGLSRLEPRSQRFSDSSVGASGRPLIVHVWSTSCAPCVQEMAALQGLIARLRKDTKLRVVLLAEDNQADLLAFLHRHKDEMPEAELYAISTDHRLRTDLGNNRTQPLTLLLDSDMVVRQAFLGSLLNRRNDLASAAQRLGQLERARHGASPERPR